MSIAYSIKKSKRDFIVEGAGSDIVGRLRPGSLTENYEAPLPQAGWNNDRRNAFIKGWKE